MTELDVAVFEEAFEKILRHYDTKDKYAIMVPSFDDWEFPLPKKVLQSPIIRLDIVNWTRENSGVDETGIYIKTAIGEEENSKHFKLPEFLILSSLFALNESFP